MTDLHATISTDEDLTANIESPLSLPASLNEITVAGVSSWNGQTGDVVYPEPTVPTKVSELDNDAGYLTDAPVRSVNGQTGDVVIDSADAYTKDETDTLLSAKANNADLARVAISGDYADLSNKPTIPTVPTNVSAFQNDAGYLTQHQSLSGYATEQWVGQQGYLTQHQSLEGYATETWVNQQGFLTQHQDLSAYATKSYVDGLVGDIESLLEAI